MKILLLTHAYNCLCQRLHLELLQMGHDLSVEFDINDAITADAVNRFKPELIIAPFLKRAIAKDIWQHHLCWIIHPGIVGDRGPSSLDWALLNQEKTWGVTVLQANEELDAGDIWATEAFPMRAASKSSLYRQEVTQAAIVAIKQALVNHADPYFQPQPLAALAQSTVGKWRGQIRQADRAIDWQQDDAESVVRKICSADGHPGLLTSLLGQQVYLFNASVAPAGLRGHPGEVVAQSNGAIAIATLDGAVWVSHLRNKPATAEQLTQKLPATDALPEALPVGGGCPNGVEYQDIWHRIDGDIGYLHFDFYNGAMGTRQCQRLRQAYLQLADSNIKAIVLMGGCDFWSNGIHLNLIEQHSSPADESWRNINAMNDLCQAIIETTDKLTVAALNANAGAGGVFLALACDWLAANDQLVLNPHYKSMGNLYGSEYWSYLLPKRVGVDTSASITQKRLPLGAIQARELGLIDALYPKDNFVQSVIDTITTKLAAPLFARFIADKQSQRQHDEQQKPLQQYREEELAKMKLNFYGFDPSYHVARYHFVYKLAKSRTPSFLAKHRVAGFGKPN